MHSLPDRYKNFSKLGSGGMGTVYRAEDTVLQKHVAIKVLRLSDLITPDSIRLFQKEAKAAGKLDHENLITVLDFGLSEAGEPYMVMDFMEGGTLSELLEKKKTLSVELAISLAQQLASGLAHAHGRGVVHRDLKPSNVIVSKNEKGEGIFKIIDFGIASLHDPNKTTTLAEKVIGTPRYMSPEQVNGQQTDERTDIYSLGCILFECLTGRAPFEKVSALETMRAKLTHPAPTLAETEPNKTFTKELEQIVSKLLQRSKDDRYQSMRELIPDLESLTTEIRSDEGELKELKVARKLDWKGLFKVGLGLLTVILLGVACFVFLIGKTPEKIKTVEPHTIRDLTVMKDEAKAIGPAVDTDEKLKLVLKEKNPKVKLYAQMITPSVAKELVASSKSILDAKAATLKPVTVLSELGGSSFAILNLDASNFNDESAKSISVCQNFGALNLSNTPITNKALLWLAKLEKLSSLKVSNTPISDSGLAYLSKSICLKNLEVSQTGVTDAGLKHLLPLSDLRSIDLNKTKITDEGLKTLKKIPALVNMDLRKTRITDAGVRGLAEVPLRSLKLEGVNLTDETIIALSRLRYLSKLELYNCGITCSQLEYFPDFRKVSTLVLDGNDLSDCNLNALTKVPRLKLLGLAECNVKDATLHSFQIARPKCKIQLPQLELIF